MIKETVKNAAKHVERWKGRKEGKKEGFGQKLHLKTSANQGLWGSVQTTTEEDTRAVRQGWRRSQAKW